MSDTIQSNKKEGVIRINNYISKKIKLVIGLLLNGNIEQAINILKDVIAYLEDYSE